jgi:hypothetical protein
MGIQKLQADWRAFLRKDRDAQLVVDGMRARTGLAEDEILFVLLETWIQERATLEQHA